MLTLADVTELLTVDERDPVWIRGAYNKLLSLSFLEVPFEVNWTEERKTPYYSHFTVLVDTTGRFSFKPAFILFILPKSSSSHTSRKEAEDKLKGLLKEADTPFTARAFLQVAWLFIATIASSRSSHRNLTFRRDFSISI
jgi:hypothetical protein